MKKALLCLIVLYSLDATVYSYKLNDPQVPLSVEIDENVQEDTVELKDTRHTNSRVGIEELQKSQPGDFQEDVETTTKFVIVQEKWELIKIFNTDHFQTLRQHYYKLPSFVQSALQRLFDLPRTFTDLLLDFVGNFTWINNYIDV